MVFHFATACCGQYSNEIIYFIMSENIQFNDTFPTSPFERLKVANEELRMATVRRSEAYVEVYNELRKLHGQSRWLRAVITEVDGLPPTRSKAAVAGLFTIGEVNSAVDEASFVPYFSVQLHEEAKIYTAELDHLEIYDSEADLTSQIERERKQLGILSEQDWIGNH